MLLADFSDDEPGSRSRKANNWYWRAAVYSAAMVVVLAVILLLVAIPNLLKNETAHGPEFARVPPLHAAQLADVPPLPPAPGRTIEDLRRILEDGHAPNPPSAAVLALVPGGTPPDSVSINSWNVHPVAHYVVSAGDTLTHVFHPQSRGVSP